MTDVVERLERELHAHTTSPLDPRRLADIRRAGRRRRTRHRVLVAGGTALAVAVLAGTPFLVLGGDRGASAPAPAAPSPSAVEDPADDAADDATDDAGDIQASPDLPADLAALQERILAEVPGAVRSSPTQVDLPDPREADPDLQPPVSGYSGTGDSIGLGVPAYSTPETFAPGAFPRWLSTGWQRFVDTAGTSGDPAVRLLARTGVRAAAGELRLRCLDGRDGGCGPELLQRSGMSSRVDRGEGGQAWLSGGDPDEVEVFRTYLAPRGEAPALVLAAVARDDVAEVTFVGGDGQRIQGRYDDSLAPGTTFLWAEVPGDLERVVVTTTDGTTVSTVE